MSAVLYHPVEHLILSDLLNVAPLRRQPEVAQASDDPDNDHLEAIQQLWSIRCTGLENAVARLCLEHMSSWFHPEEKNRVMTAEQRLRATEIKPALLCSVIARGKPDNWVTESYYVTFLPQYEVHVVTVSRCIERPRRKTYDLAIGSIQGDSKDVRMDCTIVMQGWWRQQAQMNHGPWESFWTGGMIHRQRAEKLAVDVWIDYEVEDEPSWYSENKEFYARFDFVWQGDVLFR